MSALIDIDVRPYISEEIRARVDYEDGRPRLHPLNPARWLSALARMADADEIIVTLLRAKQRRSNEANSYLWACVYEDLLVGLRGLAQDAGEKCPFKDKDALHEAMKYRFLGVDVVTFAGVVIEQRATTTKLTTAQFSNYISLIKALAAERWHIYIRESGERVAV